jgi:hypothetical protein
MGMAEKAIKKNAAKSEVPKESKEAAKATLQALTKTETQKAVAKAAPQKTDVKAAEPKAEVPKVEAAPKVETKEMPKTEAKPEAKKEADPSKEFVDGIMAEMSLKGASKKRLIRTLAGQYNFDKQRVMFKLKRALITERYAAAHEAGH